MAKNLNSARHPSEFCRVRLITPYPFTYRFRVKPTEVGHTLIHFLGMRFPFRRPDEWMNRIKNGRILVNEYSARPDQHLNNGDEISHFNPRVTEPAVPDEIRILEETPDFLIVYKPAPMPVHPGGRYFRNTLTEILKEMGHENLHVVHRLDAVTSGIVLLARHAEAAREAQQAFMDGTAEKSYFALAAGVPEHSSFNCTLPVLRRQGFRFMTGDGKGSKTAETRFELAESFQNCSIIKCNPVTGRTHQIRLHLQACGHPIFNDPVYGINPDLQSLQNTPIFLQHSSLNIPRLSIHVSLPVPENWYEFARQA